MYIIQVPLFDFEAFITSKSNDRLRMVLEVLPAEKLITTLERERWTGRRGYSVRGMWLALIAGVLYQCRSIVEVARLLERDKDIRMVCGFSRDNLPGEDALGRFLGRLVQHEDLLEECFRSLVEQLRGLLNGFGVKLAVDSTDTGLTPMAIASAPLTLMLAGGQRDRTPRGAQSRGDCFRERGNEQGAETRPLLLVRL